MSMCVNDSVRIYLNLRSIRLFAGEFYHEYLVTTRFSVIGVNTDLSAIKMVHLRPTININYPHVTM